MSPSSPFIITVWIFTYFVQTGTIDQKPWTWFTHNRMYTYENRKILCKCGMQLYDRCDAGPLGSVMYTQSRSIDCFHCRIMSACIMRTSTVIVFFCTTEKRSIMLVRFVRAVCMLTRCNSYNKPWLSLPWSLPPRQPLHAAAAPADARLFCIYHTQTYEGALPKCCMSTTEFFSVRVILWCLLTGGERVRDVVAWPHLGESHTRWLARQSDSVLRTTTKVNEKAPNSTSRHAKTPWPTFTNSRVNIRRNPKKLQQNGLLF